MKTILVIIILLFTSIVYAGLFQYVTFWNTLDAPPEIPPVSGDIMWWDASEDQVLWDASGDIVLWD